MGYFIKNLISGRQPTGTIIPSGTSANRPSPSVSGTMRFNTTLMKLEYFNGSEFVNLVTPGFSELVVDNFLGDSITSSFTYNINVSPANADQILVFVGGVYQSPLNYSTTTTQISFTEAPATNLPINIIHNLGKIT